MSTPAPAPPPADHHLDVPARRREYQRLLWRIHRKYHTVTETLRIGPIEFPFTRIADPNRVLDQVADEEDRRERRTGHRSDGDQLHLPYWAELWDSAMGMAQMLARGIIRQFVAAEQGSIDHTIRSKEPDSASPPRQRLTGAASTSLCRRPVRSQSPRVLDLGCGMGLAGVVAAHLGATVLFADLEPPALLFARLNSLPYGKAVRTRRLNWQTTRMGESFDLILGADIIYERAQWEHLEPFWRAHLKRGGTVLLGEPGRQTGDLFVDWIATRGWSLKQYEESVVTRTRPIRIYEIVNSE
jgi:2-polyprenyl-3-methyl-5-hydroxy-6-metoxy-1,4-benzoquinol methylase